MDVKSVEVQANIASVVRLAEDAADGTRHHEGDAAVTKCAAGIMLQELRHLQTALEDAADCLSDCWEVHHGWFTSALDNLCICSRILIEHIRLTKPEPRVISKKGFFTRLAQAIALPRLLVLRQLCRMLQRQSHLARELCAALDSKVTSACGPTAGPRNAQLQWRRVQRDTALLVSYGSTSVIHRLWASRAVTQAARCSGDRLVDGLLKAAFGSADRTADVWRQLEHPQHEIGSLARSKQVDRALAADFALRERECQLILLGDRAAVTTVRTELTNADATRPRGIWDKCTRLPASLVRVVDPPSCGERRKYISMMEATLATSTHLLITTDLAQYKVGQGETADDTCDYLAWQKVLFDSIVGAKWFRTSSVILVVLNADALPARSQATTSGGHILPNGTVAPFIDASLEYALENAFAADRPGLDLHTILVNGEETRPARIWSAAGECILRSHMARRVVRRGRR
ncbi:MAG: hypothetical protein INR71_01275 [Terriglobus roseus]|nr:hypothetical protein [Terriglobus roseus]